MISKKRKNKLDKARNILEDALSKVQFEQYKEEYQKEVYDALEYLHDQAWKYESVAT